MQRVGLTLELCPFEAFDNDTIETEFVRETTVGRNVEQSRVCKRVCIETEPR